MQIYCKALIAYVLVLRINACSLLRIHLLRFTTFEAPNAAIEALGGVFKPISELRGSAMSELVLLREMFNRIVGAGGG